METLKNYLVKDSEHIFALLILISVFTINYPIRWHKECEKYSIAKQCRVGDESWIKLPPEPERRRGQ